MERAAPVDELKLSVDRDDLIPYLFSNSWDAFCQAKELANPSDLICVTGSLFLIGEVLQRLTHLDSPT
jgi:folylpolyglutamate synthase/dihydropteroate synthase